MDTLYIHITKLKEPPLKITLSQYISITKKIEKGGGRWWPPTWNTKTCLREKNLYNPQNTATGTIDKMNKKDVLWLAKSDL